MLPLLAANDEVLIDLQAYRHTPPLIGDIIIARHPAKLDLQIIKRIQGMNEEGLLHLRGDNPDPIQNASITIPASLVLGRVTSRFTASQ